MATDKKRMSLYIDELLKADLEALAKVERRSVNNVIELLCEDAVNEAKKQGRIK